MNSVIIFGGDHYNALGLARVFGINGIKPYGILTVDKGQEKKVYAAKSRYWNKNWIVNSEEEGLNIIIEKFSNIYEKAVIIPSSDRAELIIDQNMNRLKSKFYVPGIRNEQGAVSRLMNKTIQNEWARTIGLKTAESCELDLYENDCIRKIRWYPCILKLYL